MALAQMSSTVEELTYDSSSPIRSGSKQEVIVGRGGLRSWKRVPLGEYAWDCSCWACRHAVEDYKPIEHYLVLHNTLVMARGFDQAWEEVQSDPEAALRDAAGRHYEEVMAL